MGMWRASLALHEPYSYDWGPKPDPLDHVCDSAPADQFDSCPLRSTDVSALYSQSKEHDGRLCGSSVALSSTAS